MSINTESDSEFEESELEQSSRAHVDTDPRQVDLLLSRMEGNNALASEYSLADLADSKLLPRRDTTGLVQLTFDEALAAIQSGEESPYSQRAGSSVRRHILNPEMPHNVGNFLYEMNAFYQGRHAGEAGQRVMNKLSGQFDLMSESRFSSQLVSSSESDLRILGEYAIVRSDVRERYIEQNFGQVFREEQARMVEWLPGILGEFGVDSDSIERSEQQLRRASMSAQDYLVNSVFSDRGDFSLLGDYLPGSLQVQVYLPGSLRREQQPNMARVRSTMAHELVHVGSAQPMIVEADDGGGEPIIFSTRAGICGREGVFVQGNESVTELMNRLSKGRSFEADGSGSYDREVATLYGMAQRKIELFAAMVSSCFSESFDPKLGLALKEFYTSLRAA